MVCGVTFCYSRNLSSYSLKVNLFSYLNITRFFAGILWTWFCKALSLRQHCSQCDQYTMMLQKDIKKQRHKNLSGTKETPHIFARPSYSILDLLISTFILLAKKCIVKLEGRLVCFTFSLENIHLCYLRQLSDQHNIKRAGIFSLE